MNPGARARLEAACLEQLGAAWDHVNQTHFRGGLRPATLALGDAETLAGTWRRSDRTITLSRRLVFEARWLQVVEVLRHEMAHQYVDEVLRAHDEPAHGPAFQQVCARHGIDATAAGLVDTPEPTGEDRVFERIRKLLALAGSPNQHEAELAARKAYALMLEHNVAWVRSERRPRFVVRQIGRVTGRFEAHEKVLGGLLGLHFFVRAILAPALDTHTGRAGRVIEICGSPENVRMAEHVYEWLLATGERLWAERRRARGGGAPERRRFLLGMLAGFRAQLDAERAGLAQTGLVWVGDPGLERFFDARNPRRSASGTVRYHADHHYEAGRAAGQDLRLHKPVEAEPAARGRQIPDARGRGK